MLALPPVDQCDLSHMLLHAESDLLSLRGERLLITGGTGFFGTWLLEAIVAANCQLNAKIETWVLSRSPETFALRSPHLAAAPGIHWLTGDVTDFSFPSGTFSHVIHAATAASATLNENNPLLMFNTITRGTERVMAFAQSHATDKILLTSSGAVYGPQPSSIGLLPETYDGAPNCLSPASAYAEGKRAMELIGSMTAGSSDLEVKIARCFAFIGPHLPLNAHFAAGNFLRDAFNKTAITIAGNGQPVRSYLYVADLVIWLLRILTTGKNLRPYNVGSDEAVTIAELAGAISDAAGTNGIEIQTPPDFNTPAPRYAPAIDRAKQELNLAVWIALPDAIKRSLSWLAKAPLKQEN